MSEDGRCEGLDVIGQDVVAAIQRGARLGRSEEHQPRAWAGAELHPLVASRGFADRDHVAPQRIRSLDPGEGRLGPAHGAHIGDRAELLDRIPVGVLGQHRGLVTGSRVAQPDRTMKRSSSASGSG